MFVSDATTLQDLTDALQQASVTTLASQLPNINTRCHAKAYADIVNALVQRGFTVAQINAWDVQFAGPLERDLTVYNCLSLAWVRAQVSPELLKLFDRREDLKSLPVITNGVFVDPAGPRGTVSTGGYDTSADLFGQPEDPRDPRLGEVTRF